MAEKEPVVVRVVHGRVMDKFPTEREEIALWISDQDSCAAFQDIAREVRKGDRDKARALVRRYRPWLSAYESLAFTAFGLL